MTGVMTIHVRLMFRSQNLMTKNWTKQGESCQSFSMNKDVCHLALRAGIIGSGFMGAVHSRAIRAAGAELVGLASSSPERAETGARELGARNPFASPADLIASADVDVVHICTPNKTHSEYALAALEAGKHVVCEKPLAMDAREARKLADLAEQSGLVAAVPFVYRYHVMAREARARIAASKSAVHTIQGVYLQDWLASATADDWRVDASEGGQSRAFADIGSHLVDLAEFISGQRIDRLSALTNTVHEHRGGRAKVETEDAAMLIAEFTNGARGILHVSQVMRGHKNELKLEVATTDNSVRFEQETPERLWFASPDGTRTIERDDQDLSDDARRLVRVPVGHPMGYQDAFNAFINDVYATIDGDIREGLPTFADGARAAEVTDAVLRSAHSGEWTRTHQGVTAPDESAHASGHGNFRDTLPDSV